VTEIRNLIGGAWTGQPEVERRNPADPTDVVSVAPRSSAEEVDDAVAAAVEAQGEWAARTSVSRGAILMDAADLLRAKASDVARDLTREEGKTLGEASGEVRRAIDVLRFFGSAGWRSGGDSLPSATPDTSVHTRAEPLGVVGLITPWNFPIAIPAWKLAPALASGNCVVIKPAELTPVSLGHLAQALVDAGLPPGVLNIVNGRGSTVGEAIVSHRDVAGVSFTGSTQVGTAIRGALERRGARVQLEMGGKNAYLVVDDADAARAAANVAAGAFGLTGQACTATSRVYVTPGIRDEFLRHLRKAAESITVGNGLEPGVDMGPVVSRQQLLQDRAALSEAVAAGLDTGGVEPAEDDGGLLFPPVVVSEVAHEHRLAREEIFGPIVTVIDVRSYDEGVAKVNDSAYGLSAGLATTSLSLAHDFAARARAGVVKVNRPTTGLDLNVPFGGVGSSSTNTFREQGERAVDFYTWSKSVYIGHD
jgi:alpha-ketoglutaric semialdehyde dehydrogenase